MSPSTKTAKTSFLIALVTGVIAFLPLMVTIKNVNTIIVISSVSGTFSLIALVTGIVYAWMATREKDIQKGDALAKWTYTDDEWAKFVVIENVANAAIKMTMLKIMIGFCALFGVGFFVMDPNGGKFVAMVMAGLAVIVTIVAFVSIRMAQNRLKTKSEAVIARDGLIFGHSFTSWSVIGSSLDGMTYFETLDPGILDFAYSMPDVRTGLRQTYSVRIPVPATERYSIDALATKLRTTVKRA